MLRLLCTMRQRVGQGRALVAMLLIESAALALSGCGSTIQAQRINQVKRMAVVSYEAVIDRDGSGGLGAVFNKRTPRISNAEQAASLYTRLGDVLRDKFGWEVLSREQILANPNYTTFYESKKQNAMFARFQKLNQTFDGSYFPEGIFNRWESMQFNAADRAALRDALGVDAIAMAYLDLTPASGWSVGSTFSQTRYSAQITFYVYDAETGKAIWYDVVTGKKGSSTPNTKVAGFSFGSGDKDMNAFFEAIENGYTALIDSYSKDAAKQAEEAAKAAAAAVPKATK